MTSKLTLKELKNYKAVRKEVKYPSTEHVKLEKILQRVLSLSQSKEIRNAVLTLNTGRGEASG